MDFNLSEEQKILKDTARSFLANECSSDFVREMEQDQRGYTPDLWRKMAELGWMALVLPEEYNGLGASILDVVLMMEEMGRVCLPGPFLSNLLGAMAILEAGNEAQKSEYLPRVAAGDLVLCLAFCEPCSTQYEPGYVATKAVAKGEGFILNGTKLFVSDAHVSDYLICTIRTEGESLSQQGISLFLVPRQTTGVKLTPLKTIAADKQFEVVLEDVAVPPENLLGKPGRGWPALEKVLKIAALAKCGEMVGGAQKVLEMTVDYAKERVQFGRPIGMFQSIQHHCANMLLDVEGSRHITYKAACLMNEDPSSELWVATAKGLVSEAFRRVITLGHQIGGGTAIMTEHDMTLYSRRAKAAEVSFGDAAYHRRAVASALGL